MCGIAGYAAAEGVRLSAEALGPMLERLAHRGPDDQGHYATADVVLGHRRLSVIDLSAGHQPLSGARPTTVLVVNGEIYNYRELRRELERAGHSFRTASDSEVAAHAYDRWGDAFLDRLDGMFALALWDEARQRLLLARDRLGEKPLFYTERVGILIFASELSALLAHPNIPQRYSTRWRSLNTWLWSMCRPPAASFTACTSSSRVAPWPGSGANCDPGATGRSNRTRAINCHTRRRWPSCASAWTPPCARG